MHPNDCFEGPRELDDSKNSKKETDLREGHKDQEGWEVTEDSVVSDGICTSLRMVSLDFLFPQKDRARLLMKM